MPLKVDLENEIEGITGQDVTKRFKMLIRSGFWIMAINLLREILVQIAIWKNLPRLLYASYIVFSANITLTIMWFVFAQIFRWGQPGKVCSGDYLPEGYPEAEARSNYLTSEGLFIKAILIILYSVAGLSALTVCVSVFILAQKVSHEQRKDNIFKQKV